MYIMLLGIFLSYNVVEEDCQVWMPQIPEDGTNTPLFSWKLLDMSRPIQMVPQNMAFKSGIKEN